MDNSRSEQEYLKFTPQYLSKDELEKMLETLDENDDIQAKEIQEIKFELEQIKKK